MNKMRNSQKDSSYILNMKKVKSFIKYLSNIKVGFKEKSKISLSNISIQIKILIESLFGEKYLIELQKY